MSSTSSKFRTHQYLWLEDGNIVLRSQEILFCVHRSILSRTSLYFQTKILDTRESLQQYNGHPIIDLESEIKLEEFEALLYHLYHHKPLLSDSPFEHASQILRASSRLDFPQVRKVAIDYLESKYPRRPAPHEPTKWSNLPEAAQLAIDCSITKFTPPRTWQLLPSLLYGVILTSDFEIDDEHLHSSSSIITNGTSPLPSAPHGVYKICAKLMHQIINHFTPILFTVATGLHMACTELLADHWMTLVIQPALEDSGVSKPLETLQRIKGIDWESLGLCKECCESKRQEWDDEADEFWAKLESWVDPEGELFSP